ncbi:uncharacterized protein K460DRAFT_89288 [Cucurbitaria berberidis CBS 394.84]|uniref:Uncharacterized protein n=1 Tax=Cucurbitaria berberidis CBS 394.84 TaxID=1168544 RepID=A0A9P4GQL1_9PLEO|nr:uncharacterized protein K460DRAFT_89288 [Cucurbitaria berberidis CBS 394.84]KAF1849341.1 hypothetical protein K460DRAFT_89288 [Cucurbitaria berberidis CBS 394.84]
MFQEAAYDSIVSDFFSHWTVISSTRRAQPSNLFDPHSWTQQSSFIVLILVLSWGTVFRHRFLCCRGLPHVHIERFSVSRMSVVQPRVIGRPHSYLDSESALQHGL